MMVLYVEAAFPDIVAFWSYIVVPHLEVNVDCMFLRNGLTIPKKCCSLKTITCTC